MAKKKWTPIKKLWVWLFVIILCLIIFFILGVIIGYVLLGKGSFQDVFLPYTWTHIFEFFK